MSSRAWWVLALCAFLVSACGGTPPPKAAAQKAKAQPKVRIVVTSRENTNDGSVVQVLVRRVSPVDYQKEDYAEIVPLLSQKDNATLAWAQLLPGEPLEVTVDRPSTSASGEDGAAPGVGVYFLFTRPGPRWKVFLPDVECFVIELDEEKIQEAHPEGQ